MYTERVAALQTAITAKPNDANALVDLAAFYLKPLAPRTVEATDGTVRTFNVPLRNEIIPDGIKNMYAVPWVFRGDTSAAWPLLTKALAIDPRKFARRGNGDVLPHARISTAPKTRAAMPSGRRDGVYGSGSELRALANGRRTPRGTHGSRLADYVVDPFRGTHTCDKLAKYSHPRPLGWRQFSDDPGSRTAGAEALADLN